MVNIGINSYNRPFQFHCLQFLGGKEHINYPFNGETSKSLPFGRKTINEKMEHIGQLLKINKKEKTKILRVNEIEVRHQRKILVVGQCKSEIKRDDKEPHKHK